MTAGAWRRRWGRSLAALGVMVMAASMASRPATALSTPPLPLTITISRIAPTAPQPGDLITVEGQISNPPTGVEYDNLSVGLQLDPAPLLSRAALLAEVNATDHLPTGVGIPRLILSLQPGASAPFKLTVNADDLGLNQAGVYRFSVEATHVLDGAPVYEGRVDTFLPWLPPSAAVTPVQVAWLWPLLSTPHLQPDNSFSDDTLSTEIGAHGRLGGLLDVANQAAGQSGTVPPQRAPLRKGQVSPDPEPVTVAVHPVPVTPVIDPETVQELELMQDPGTPYQVRLQGGTGTSAGTGQAAATTYLTRLRQLMDRTSSIAVPYGDPDIEALATAKASALVTQARSTGLESSLPGVVNGLVWPPDGGLSETALNQLTTSGLVLSSKALPVTSTPAYTPTAVAAVDRTGGTVPAVVVDDGLSHLVTKQAHGADRVLISQRFAAETAAIALESSGTSLGTRALVIAPARRWSPTNTAVRALLSESGRLPWLTPKTVPQILQQDQPDPAVTRGPLQSAAATGTTTGLMPEMARQIGAANVELGGFRSILCPLIKSSTGSSPAPTTTATAPVVGAPASPTGTTATSPNCNRDDQVLTLQRSLYRTASVALAKPNGNAALLALTLTSLRAAEGKVSIVTKGEVNLLGHRARLPITIVNDLTVPVKVRLVLTPRSPGLTASKAQTVVILAGTRPQLDVTVSTVKAGAGTLLVDAQLQTPQGTAFGAPVRLRVRVSAYGAVVVTITIAVASLLGLAVIVRLYRRIRNARRGTPDGPADPGTDQLPDAEPA